MAAFLELLKASGGITRIVEASQVNTVSTIKKKDPKVVDTFALCDTFLWFDTLVKLWLIPLDTLKNPRFDDKV